MKNSIHTIILVAFLAVWHIPTKTMQASLLGGSAEGCQTTYSIAPFVPEKKDHKPLEKRRLFLKAPRTLPNLPLGGAPVAIQSNTNAQYVPFEEKTDGDFALIPKLFPTHSPASTPPVPHGTVQGLIKDLGDNFLNAYCAWHGRQIKRVQTLECNEGWPPQKIVLLCAIELCGTKRDDVYGLSKEESHEAISKILASGLCSVHDWDLPRHQSWARQAFWLAHDAEAYEALCTDKEGAVLAFRTVLERPELRIHEHKHIFFYLIDPTVSAEVYCEARIAEEKCLHGQQTPLMLAALFGHYDVVLYILRTLDAVAKGKSWTLKQAELSCKDGFGKTALDYACQYNQQAIIELLAHEGVWASEGTVLYLIKREKVAYIRLLLHRIVFTKTLEQAAQKQSCQAIIDLFTHAQRNRRVYEDLKGGNRIHETDLKAEIDRLNAIPGKITLQQNNGVAAGLHMLAIKGLLDDSDDDESSAE